MSPVTIILLLLLILLNRVSPDPTDDLNDDEKNALLFFFDQVRPNPSYIWKSSEPPCKTPWKGVECDATNKTVWYLRLPAASLTGEIPPGTIGKLPNLRVLSLHENHLKGNIPSDFSGLDGLTGLFLHKNLFSGELPDIKNLTYLDVSKNKLSGPIPSSLSKFPESAFSKNDNLCGAPLRPCNETLNPRASEQPKKAEDNKSKNKKKHLILGISVGSGLLLLIFLCCMRKTMYPKSKQDDKEYYVEAPTVLAVGATEVRNKLVSLDDEINTYDVDELLGASAELLGKGSFGRTYKRVVEGKKMIVVLKELKDVVVTKIDFESQMQVLGKMKNDNVVSLRAYCYTENVKWLVCDYMPSGSLSAHLHGCSGLSGRRLDWNHRLSVALSAAKGLAYLHASNVVHGNIKSSNILLRQKNNTHASVSVSDYGLSTLFGKGSPTNHRISGYMAPEVLTTTNFSLRSDVYSFGVLLLELLTRKTPNKASSRELWNEFHMWVQSVVCEEQKDEIFDAELRRDQNIQEMFHMLRITKKCVSFVPHERPTMHELVSLMEEMPRVEIDDWFRQSSDDPSKGYEYTPSTDTRGTPSTITP